jgi:uncharacterized protein YdeI (YjbR/CyaY-like superfamily)
MKTLYVRSREEWRSWLARNGKKETEAWLIYPKKNSDQVRIPYEDAVEEALCFGWIDGKTKRLDEQRFMQRFTPRRPGSRWSEINIKRARKMIRRGCMTEAGLAVFTPERKVAAHPTELPAELQQQLKKNEAAWGNFQKFPPYYQRMTVAWVASAKRKQTQVRRLDQLIDFSARNKRIKFM